MSYGNPCMRITGCPLAGPASTYPVLSTPALTCRTGPNAVLAGCTAARAARAAPSKGSAVVAAAPAAATPRNRRRSWLTSPCGSLVCTVEAPSPDAATIADSSHPNTELGAGRNPTPPSLGELRGLRGRREDALRERAQRGGEVHIAELLLLWRHLKLSRPECGSGGRGKRVCRLQARHPADRDVVHRDIGDQQSAQLGVQLLFDRRHGAAPREISAGLDAVGADVVGESRGVGGGCLGVDGQGGVQLLELLSLRHECVHGRGGKAKLGDRIDGRGFRGQVEDAVRARHLDGYALGGAADPLV